MTEENGDEGFLKRWSRRKREADSGLTPNDQDSSHLQDRKLSPAEDEHAKTANLSEPPQVGEADAERKGDAAEDFSEFDYESLDANSDYTRFMKDDVPSDVRSKALQQLWLSDPQFAHIDGLLEYAEDYTDAAVVPIGAVATAYRVGKGFLSDDEVEKWEKLGKKDSKSDADRDPREAAAAEETEDAGANTITSQEADEPTEDEHDDVAVRDPDQSETAATKADERNRGDDVTKKPT